MNLGCIESFDLVIYKHIHLEYVMRMLKTRMLQFEVLRKGRMDSFFRLKY